MIPSYIITTLQHVDKLALHTSHLKDAEISIFTLNEFCIAIKDKTSLQKENIFVEYENGYLGLLGKIFNKEALHNLLQSLEPTPLVLENDSHMFILLYKHFGSTALNYIDGCFSILYFKNDGSIDIFSSPMVTYPLYYYNIEDSFWSFINREGF